MQFASQPHAMNYLSHAWRHGRLAHAYAFVGPAGLGQVDAALEFSAALNCKHASFASCHQCGSCKRIKAELHPDVRVYRPDPEKRSFSIEKIRDEVLPDIQLMPLEGWWRVAIIDQAVMMSTEAANAFLKTLEEPPRRAIIILIVTEWRALLETVRSRVQPVRFVPQPIESVMDEVRRDIPDADPSLIQALAPLADGSPGHAKELLAEGFGPLRSWLLERVVVTPSRDPVEAAEGLIEKTKHDTDQKQEDQRVRLAAVLGQIALWWRDAIVHGKFAMPALDFGAIEAWKPRAQSLTTTQLIDHVNRLLDLRRDLSMNMNLTLWALKLMDLAANPGSVAHR